MEIIENRRDIFSKGSPSKDLSFQKEQNPTLKSYKMNASSLASSYLFASQIPSN